MNREITLGHNSHGERVTVEIALRPVERAVQTVDHDQATDGVELSIVGTVYPRGWRPGWDIRGGGQCIDELSDIVKPADGWTSDEIAELAALWRRWHLNAMRAGCAHQTKIVYEDSNYGRRIDLDGTTAANDCPAGYRYGSAWLYEPLPADVVERVHFYQRRLRPVSSAS